MNLLMLREFNLKMPCSTLNKITIRSSLGVTDMINLYIAPSHFFINRQRFRATGKVIFTHHKKARHNSGL